MINQLQNQLRNGLQINYCIVFNNNIYEIVAKNEFGIFVKDVTNSRSTSMSYEWMLDVLNLIKIYKKIEYVKIHHPELFI